MAQGGALPELHEIVVPGGLGTWHLQVRREQSNDATYLNFQLKNVTLTCNGRAV